MKVGEHVLDIPAIPRLGPLRRERRRFVGRHAHKTVHERAVGRLTIGWDMAVLKLSGGSQL
jgi:hypothetical protein